MVPLDRVNEIIGRHLEAEQKSRKKDLDEFCAIADPSYYEIHTEKTPLHDRVIGLLNEVKTEIGALAQQQATK